jgi:VCBS repeat-containing protein
MRQRVVRSFLLVSLVPPLAAWAQAPAGTEFQVNTNTFLAQSEPAVAADSAGNFVVVWQSALQDGDGLGVFGQRFDAQGIPQGAEFQVNAFSAGDQAMPSVAFPAPGGFVVVWQSRDQDGSAYGVFGQRFNAVGAAQGPEFRVNTSTAGSQRNAAVAAAPAGGFVVVWESEAAPSNSEIFAQRYDASGTPQGGEFQVNSFTGGEQRYPAIAADPSGNFVVGWQSDGQDGSDYGIFGQRFDVQGTALGGEFAANSFTPGGQRFPAVAADPSGNVFVVWDSEGQDGSGRGIYAQRFDALGAAQGSEFRIMSYVTGDQFRPSVAADASGDFFVTWEGVGRFDDAGVYGRLYTGSGEPAGPRSVTNTHLADTQGGVSVAASSYGGFVVTWHSYLQDGSEWGVYAQRFADVIFKDGFEPANAAPVAVDDAFDVDEDDTLSGSSVLANDTDAENDGLTAVLVDDVSNGALVFNADGTFEYTPGPDFNGTDSFTYRAHDGTQESNLATVTLTVNAVNDAPVVTAGGLLTYTEDDPAAVVDGGVTATDLDSASLAGATVRISGNYASGQDVLSFVDTATITGSFNAGTGTLTLTGTDTVANYQAALATVRYQNTSQAPSTLARTVTWIVDDGAAANNLSLPATSTINVTAVNDAPFLSAGGTLNYTENQAATAIDVTITVTDVDSNNLASATAQIANNYQNGADVLSFVNTATITGSFVAATGVLTLTGTDTRANYELALRSVRYHNTSDAPSTAARTVVWQVNDGAAVNNLSNTPTSTINVTAVNDAPTATAKAHSTHSGIRITIGAGSTGKLLEGATDPDDPAGDLAASPTFTAVTPAGATVTLLDPATGTFTYNPPAGYSGAASFQFTVCDDGVPVAPSQCSASQTVSFTVTGPDLWFVDAGAAPGGSGRLTDPFNSLASLPGARGTNDRIFVASGTYATGHTFLVSERLVGQGSFGASFDAALGVIVPGNGTLDPRPSLGGVAPILQGTVTMAAASVLSGVAISSGAATGLAASGAALITVLQTSVTSTVTAVNVSASSAGPLGVSFTSTTSSGGANGILLANVDGTFSFGGGSLTNNTTAAFVLTNTAAHAPTIAYTGNITPAVNARAVDIGGAGAGSGLTGGSVTLSGTLTTSVSGGANANAGGIRVRNGNAGALTLSGANKTFNAGPNHGVELATNPGVSVSFNGGGLDIDTTSGMGFTATGGGTVAVTTGANANTIDSTTGTALNVANTTIGASGLTFRSISANGAANGIVLNTTGSSGGLSVTGNTSGNCGGSITVQPLGTPSTANAPVTADCSGGTIQATTGAGILLTNTANVSLTRMRIQNSAADEINASTVNGLTIDHSFITDASGVAGDRGIEIGDFSTGTPVNGAITISNSTIGPTPHDNVAVGISSGTSTWSITSTVFTGSSLNSGFNFEIRNATVSSFTMDGSVLQNQFADGMQMQPASGVSATITSATIQNSTFVNNNIGIDVNHDGTSNVTYRVLNNTFRTHAAQPINFFTSASVGTGGTANGRFENNFIGTAAVAFSGSALGNGIRVNVNGGAVSRVLLNGNVIRQAPNGRGIEIISRNGTGGTDATVTNNQVDTDFVPTAQNGGFSLSNIFMQSNCLATCNTLRSDVRANTVPAVAPNGELIAFQLALIRTGASTNQLVDNPPVSANATAELQSQNTGSAGASATVTLIPGPINTPP